MMTGEKLKQRKDYGVVVPPRSAKDIEAIANGVRTAVGLQFQPFFPIVAIYDLIHELIPGASYDVRTTDEMEDNHGLTRLKKKEIQIREDVFKAACLGDGFGRFTLCHELGHLLLHRGGVALQRARADPPLYMSSEWQSDRFAGSLLMPTSLIPETSTVELLMEMFGVSRSAAQVRLSQINQQKTKGAMKQAS